jgi:hypothetical protein
MIIIGGIGRISGIQQSKAVVTEIINFKKKSQSFTEIPFIWLNNLKFVEHRKSDFLV